MGQQKGILYLMIIFYFMFEMRIALCVGTCGQALCRLTGANIWITDFCGKKIESGQ